MKQRRSCTLFADAHGEVKVNAWEAPTQIAKWKEEHVSWITFQPLTFGPFQHLPQPASQGLGLDSPKILRILC